MTVITGKSKGNHSYKFQRIIFSSVFKSKKSIFNTIVFTHTEYNFIKTLCPFFFWQKCNPKMVLGISIDLTFLERHKNP